MIETKDMPAKNVTKIYIEGGYYHIYNRGVEKRNIFQDDQDYAVFLSYLEEYLLPKGEDQLHKRLSDPDTSYGEKEQILKLLRLNNFYEEIICIAYCLMPNHLHFLIKQNSKLAIDKFMNSLITRYVMYFNKKYQRVGYLFQDVYKAIQVITDEQLLYLTSYIHRNPMIKNNVASKRDPLKSLFSRPSSYPDYLERKSTLWVHPEEILPYFSKTNPKLSYQAFVEQTEDFSIINKLTIDD